MVASGRELRASGKVADRDPYRSLFNVQAQVNERYAEVIDRLRQQVGVGSRRDSNSCGAICRPCASQNS
jgi:hypothetical protein